MTRRPATAHAGNVAGQRPAPISGEQRIGPGATRST